MLHLFPDTLIVYDYQIVSELHLVFQKLSCHNYQGVSGNDGNNSVVSYHVYVMTNRL